MNEKFWDLKKSRQDNMINGALKVFARDGFRHASTDEIVAEANVSKGLLFHYFYSKVGVYEFLTEYCARFALVEINSELRRKDIVPFFELQHKMTAAEAVIMRRYPYLILFLDKAYHNEGSGIREEVLYNIGICTERLEGLLEIAQYPEGMTAEDARRIDGFLRLARLDTAARILEKGDFSAEKYTAAMTSAIQFFEKFYAT